MNLFQSSFKCQLTLFLHVKPCGRHLLRLLINPSPISPLLCINSLFQAQQPNFIPFQFHLKFFSLILKWFLLIPIPLIFSFIFCLLVSGYLICFRFEILQCIFHFIYILLYWMQIIGLICGIGFGTICFFECLFYLFHYFCEFFIVIFDVFHYYFYDRGFLYYVIIYFQLKYLLIYLVH